MIFCDLFVILTSLPLRVSHNFLTVHYLSEQKEEQRFNQRLLHIFDVFLKTFLTLLACYQSWEVTEKFLSRPQEVNIHIHFGDMEDLYPVDVSVCYVYNVGNCSYFINDQTEITDSSLLFGDGYDEGYDEGYDDGYDEGYDEEMNEGRLKI